jgi:hypothetical protein
MSEDESNKTWGETLTDALFLSDCFRKKNVEFDPSRDPNDNELPRVEQLQQPENLL